jgi:hypothetical protein
VETVKKYKGKIEVHYHSRKRSCAEEVLESITCSKHPLIASGATTIGSARRAPDKISTKIMQLGR